MSREAQIIKDAQSSAIEQCIALARATKVQTRGHPQIDAPNPGDMQDAIVATLEAFLQLWKEQPLP